MAVEPQPSTAVETPGPWACVARAVYRYYA